MIRASFIVLVAVAVFYSSVASAQEQPPCGVNEARYPCGKSCEVKCNKPLPGYCKGIQCNLPFNCRCKNGFARNEQSGMCVAKEDCPAPHY